MKATRIACWCFFFPGKTRIVQIRAAEDGMVSQQLLFADEVRSLAELHIEHVAVTGPPRLSPQKAADIRHSVMDLLVMMHFIHSAHHIYSPEAAEMA